MVAAATVPAVAVNVAEVAPAGIVTEAGTDTRAEFEASVTTTPAGGAGLDRVTVP